MPSWVVASREALDKDNYYEIRAQWRPKDKPYPRNPEGKSYFRRRPADGRSRCAVPEGIYAVHADLMEAMNAAEMLCCPGQIWLRT